MVQKPIKKLSRTQALQKILVYCAYQERTHREVREKLYGYGLYSGDVDEIIVHLITEDYLNEERFARLYSGGKFRVKSWGRIKIIHALESKGLTKNCIHLGLQEIDESDYMDTLRKILIKKSALTEGEDSFVKRSKIASYAIQKGFESPLVWKLVDEIVSE